MTFDQTLEYLREQVGKQVEVSVDLAVATREESAHLAAFTGRVHGLSQSGARALPDVWYVALAETEAWTEVTLNRDLFEGAEVEANVVSEPELRSETGSTWTLTIRQRDVITTVDVFR